MLTKKITYIALLFCLLLCHSNILNAQDSLLLRDYRYIQQSSPWLTSTNAATLTRFQTQNIAEAELSLQYGKGALCNYYQADKELLLDAAIESYYRVSSRTVVYGKMGYENYNGWGMTGSAWIDPTHKPFDIVEATLDNPGKKHRDTYQLTGAVGVDLGKGVALGAKVDYTTANYAKYKDLRHKNSMMDLQVSAGVYVAATRWLGIGANYLYHRNTESLNFSMYGKDDKVYNSLISFGTFMGPVEQFGSRGYTDKANEMPLVDDGNGFGVQVDFRLTDELSFHNSLTYLYHQGYYGKKSPTTITYANHNGYRLAYLGQLSYKRGAAHHLLAVGVETEKIENNGATYRELMNDNGAYHYEYYEDVKTGDRRWASTSIDYTGHLGIRGELPTWTIKAGLHFLERKQKGIRYPFFRRQSLKRTEASIEGERNMVMKKGVLTATLGVSYAKGSGAPYQDGTYTALQSGQTPPASMDAFLYQEHHYLTASQYGVGLQARYAFLFPSTRLKTHVRAAFEYHRATETSDYCGRDHTTATIAIGCAF